jgi:acetyltransferase-like isoleucine patch superfamily enzyme
MKVFRQLISKTRKFFLYWLKCHGNKILFLRTQGVRIGTDCDIITKANNFGSEPWLVEIGNHVTLTLGVTFITHDASSRLFRDKIHGMNRHFGNRYGTIRILDNSFIGINAIILPGVTIGPDSIVGTGSLVTRTVPPSTVWAGNPARHICTLDEFIERYESKMIPVNAVTRDDLRKELTTYFWNEER